MIDRKKMIGSIIVIIIAIALVILIWKTMNTALPGGDYTLTSHGDWQYNGEYYCYRNLKCVLLIGVGDLNEKNDNKKIEYLSLLAVDDIHNTYSLLNINSATQASINCINDMGVRSGDAYIGKISEAQTYGDGGALSCANTARSVKALLYGVDVDAYICIRTNGQTPLFTSNPITQIEQLINAESETTEDGQTVSAYVATDLKTEKLLSLWNTMLKSTFTGIRTFDGTVQDGIFIPDKVSSDKIIADLYFTKNNQ